jgi:hypothetical protein
MQEFQYNAAMAAAARLEAYDQRQREVIDRLGQQPPPDGQDEQLRTAVRASIAAVEKQDGLLLSLSNAQQTARAEMRQQMDAFVRETQAQVDQKMTDVAATQFSSTEQLREAFKEYMRGDHRAVSSEVGQTFAQLQNMIQEATALGGAASASVGDQLTSLHGNMSQYANLTRALSESVQELTGGIRMMQQSMDSLGDQMLRMGAATGGEVAALQVARVPRTRQRPRGISRQEMAGMIGEIFHAMQMQGQTEARPRVLPELASTVAIEDITEPPQKKRLLAQEDDDGPRPSGVPIVV